jgi:hypothetical protein
LQRPYTTNSTSPHYANTIGHDSIGQLKFLRVLTGNSIPWHTEDFHDSELFLANWVGKSYQWRDDYIRGPHVMTIDAQHVLMIMKTTIMFTSASTLPVHNGVHQSLTRYTTSSILSSTQISWQLYVLDFVHILMTVPRVSPTVSPKDTHLHHTMTSSHSRTISDGTISYAEKISKEWKHVQYQYAKRYGLIKQSEGWVLGLIKLMANSLFQLWELRNQCRHGHDNATRQQSLAEQAHREIRCLYQLKPLTLPQDQNLFRHSVDEHLTETVPQLRTWIVHNKKLILHSVRVAKAQVTLHTHRIQRFFPRHRAHKSTMDTNRPTQAPKRHRITRITTYFPTLACSRPQQALQTVAEDNELIMNALQRRLIRRRQLNLPDLFPDHPG